MSDYWKDIKKLADFSLSSISAEDVPNTLCRLILLNTKPGRSSQYLVTAYPNTAKESVRSGIVTIWPEVVIGILVETHGDGSQTDGREKSWTLHPTLKTGRGWRKKSVMMVRGREFAASQLLGWWTKQNGKKA